MGDPVASLKVETTRSRHEHLERENASLWLPVVAVQWTVVRPTGLAYFASRIQEPQRDHRAALVIGATQVDALANNWIQTRTIAPMTSKAIHLLHS